MIRLTKHQGFPLICKTKAKPERSKRQVDEQFAEIEEFKKLSFGITTANPAIIEQLKRYNIEHFPTNTLDGMLYFDCGDIVKEKSCEQCERFVTDLEKPFNR